MLHSLSAQVSFYSKMIQEHPGWLYCGVYADEAFTGTKENRADFQRLLSECRAGNIDLIITKSISRFARNTVTLLQTVRELKMLGVDVYFEEQNMWIATEVNVIATSGEFFDSILLRFVKTVNANVLAIIPPFNSRCKMRQLHWLRLGEVLIAFGHIQTIEPRLSSRTRPIKEQNIRSDRSIRRKHAVRHADYSVQIKLGQQLLLIYTLVPSSHIGMMKLSL